MNPRQSTTGAAADRSAQLGRGLSIALVLVLCTMGATSVARAQPKQPDKARDSPRPATSENIVGRIGDVLLQKFRSVWPDPPEAVAMLLDILQGSRLGPGEGWFQKAVAQTRYDWNATRKQLDHDGDGRICREEFPGSDADFTRLDRDHDGVLGEPDFDFSAHALVPSPASVLFYRADRDGNGKLTRAEIEEFFQAADSSGEGFLSLADVQEALAPLLKGKGSSGGPREPSKLTLLKGLVLQEIGSLRAGPALGSPAPDFTLKTVDGRQAVTLSRLIGPRPVVLVFGNFTCGPFRAQAGNVEKLFRRNHKRAAFVMIYVREAHPADGWQLESNERVGVTLPQPRSYDERVTVAQACSSRLGLGMPMLVDTIDDAVGARYSGMPSRLYLLDRKGRIAFKSGRGPFGFKPAELEHALILLLQDEFAGLKTDGSSAPGASRDAGKNRDPAQLHHRSAATAHVPPVRLP